MATERNPAGMLLRAARDAKGLTQEDVGDMLGMTSNGYGKIERGRNGVPSDCLHRICRGLEISPMKLLQAIAGEHAPDDDRAYVKVRMPGSGRVGILPGVPGPDGFRDLVVRDTGYSVLFTPEDWDIHVAMCEYAGIDPRSPEAVKLSEPVINAHAMAECRRRLAAVRENESEDDKSGN